MRGPVLALALCGAGGCLTAAATVGGADEIVLGSGARIAAEQAWFEAGEIRYLSNGGLYRVARELVERIDTADGGPPAHPDVARSRARLAEGDAAEALRLARLAAFRDPASPAALQALAAAQLALGDAARARASAESAVALEPRNAAAHELLGDALVEQADFVAAREQYRTAHELGPRPGLQQKLESLFASASSASSARFRLQYDGGADQPLGLAVLRVLDAAWQEHAQALGFHPTQPVTVVLQTATAFRDTTRAPGWAAAWNDGTIRVPVMGLTAPTPGLVRLLRHELAHTFLASRAGAGCPTWLHEGVAQWLEGGDPAREDAAVAARARAKRLARLESLESSFTGLSEADAAGSYAESLSATAHLLRRGGSAGLRRLIEALGRGQPAAEALPAAVSSSYAEFQRDWESYLVGTSSATRRLP